MWRLIAAASVSVLLAVAARAAVVSSFSDIEYWVGSGPKRAALVVDWQDGKNLSGSASGQALAWGYRWQNGEIPKALDMLKAIAAADPRFELSLAVRGMEGTSVFGMFYDLDGDGGTATFDPVNEEGSASDTDDHFAEGWFFNGYWAYYVGNSSNGRQPAWSYSGSGAGNRTLLDGDWDGWAFSDYDEPTTPTPVLAAAAPLPEPGSTSLLLFGGLVLCRRKT